MTKDELGDLLNNFADILDKEKLEVLRTKHVDLENIDVLLDLFIQAYNKTFYSELMEKINNG